MASVFTMQELRESDDDVWRDELAHASETTPAEGSSAPSQTSRGSSTVEIDPSLYEPLSDVPRRSKQGWAPHKTAVIPRVAAAIHGAPETQPPAAVPVPSPAVPDRRQWLQRGVGGVLLLGGVVGVWISLRTPELVTQPRAARRSAGAVTTLISSEPPGSEVFEGGVVIGTTPYEAVLPASGERLYVLRRSGFSPRTVRLTSGSGSAVHVRLVAASR